MTPIDLDELKNVLHLKGAYCGACDYESGDCAECDDVLTIYATAIKDHLTGKDTQ